MQQEPIKDEICMMCHFSSECGKCCLKCTEQCNSRQVCMQGKPNQAERVDAWMNIIDNNSATNHLKKTLIKEITLNDKNQKTKEVRKEKHCMSLLVAYTDKEMAALARKFSELDTERDNIAKRKAAAMAGYKADQEEQQEAIDKIKERIAKGGALGTVECESSLDEKSRIIDTVRLDTGEIVEGIGHPIMNLKDKKKDVPKEDQEIEMLIKKLEDAKKANMMKEVGTIQKEIEKRGFKPVTSSAGTKWVKITDEKENKTIENLVKWWTIAKNSADKKSMKKISNDLKAKGVTIKDTKDGIKWEKIDKKEEKKDGDNSGK